MSEPTESERYVHLTSQYLTGNGVDLGCGSKPVVPWAIAFDLPEAVYVEYHGGNVPGREIQFGGDARDLPFKSDTLDFVYSSHLLEDFYEWTPILREWARVIKPGGHLVILVPDKERFAEAVRQGQPPNTAHQHESWVGELTEQIGAIGGFEVIEDRFTDTVPGDYTILFAAKKL